MMKSLRNERDRHRGADPGEIGEVPLEIGGVGEHAEAGGAVRLVGPGDGDRVEVGADDLGRGAGLLDLGDQLDRSRAGKGGAEVADRGGRGGLVLHLLERHPVPGRGHLPPLRGDDLVEDGRRHSREPCVDLWSLIRGPRDDIFSSMEDPPVPILEMRPDGCQDLSILSMMVIASNSGRPKASIS